jgi:hypothetical protein
MRIKTISISLAALSLIGIMGTASAFAATKTTHTTPPTFPHHGFGNGAGHGMMGSLPTILKISKTTLQTDLKNGDSILQIAQKKGISEKSLIAAMEKADQAQLNKLVTSKKITATQEQQMIKRYDSTITKMITSKHTAKSPT